MAQSDKNYLKTLGRWTKNQHEMFLKGMEMYGKDWKKIEELIGTRNGAQIRSHAQKFFLRIKKQFDFDPTPDQLKSNTSATLSTKTHQLSQQSQESNDYSFFVQKIVKKTNQKERLDFWESFVDQKSCEEFHEMETGISKRKNSFMLWGEEDLDSIQNAQPVKRVKTQ